MKGFAKVLAGMKSTGVIKDIVNMRIQLLERMVQSLQFNATKTHAQAINTIKHGTNTFISILKELKSERKEMAKLMKERNLLHKRVEDLLGEKRWMPGYKRLQRRRQRHRRRR